MKKIQILFRLTFKIDDVPAHLMKQTAGLRWAGMWVKEPWERMWPRRTEPRAARWGRRSVNRLLGDRFGCLSYAPTSFLFFLFIILDVINIINNLLNLIKRSMICAHRILWDIYFIIIINKINQSIMNKPENREKSSFYKVLGCNLLS